MVAKALILIPALLASALASQFYPVAYYPAPQSHYSHSQNTLTGEYAFSYSGGPSSKVESKGLDGVTHGAYSYIDAHGQLQHVNYVADDDGFRVAGTDLPSGLYIPQDEPRVAEAKRRHLEEHARLSQRNSRKKRSILAAAFPGLALAARVPLATSSQSRVQFHRTSPIGALSLAEATRKSHLLSEEQERSKKEQLQEKTKAEESDTVIIEDKVTEEKADSVAKGIVAPVVPLATSSQSRYQIHDSSRIEIPAGTLAVKARPIALKTLPVYSVSLPYYSYYQSIQQPVYSQGYFDYYSPLVSQFYPTYFPIVGQAQLPTLVQQQQQQQQLQQQQEQQQQLLLQLEQQQQLDNPSGLERPEDASSVSDDTIEIESA